MENKAKFYPFLFIILIFINKIFYNILRQKNFNYFNYYLYILCKVEDATFVKNVVFVVRNRLC